MEDMLKKFESAVTRLENAITRVEQLEKRLGSSQGGASNESSGDTPRQVEEFERLINEYIKPMVEYSKKLGGQEVVGVTDLLSKVCEENKNLIVLASKSKKPSDNDIPEVIKGLSGAIGQVME